MDKDGLVVLVAGRHDDEQIHVAVLMWCAGGVGAEQDDVSSPPSWPSFICYLNWCRSPDASFDTTGRELISIWAKPQIQN